ncbi:MAG: hypothetical protein GY862_11365 [Gammaproteobacteria bacterium]|nr:hypothetical protein [Gammaproteobacteria bacterium]
MIENLNNYLLGETCEALACTDAEENRQAALAMIQQTERYLDILSRDFEPAIYDNDECYDAMMELALRNTRYSRIRILIHEPGKTVMRGHRVLDLGKRLSSFFHFRQPAEEHRGIPKTFLIADEIGFLCREYTDSLKAAANFCDPMGAKELLELFQTLWNEAESHPDLRILTL